MRFALLALIPVLGAAAPEAPRSPMALAWEEHMNLPWDPSPPVAFVPAYPAPTAGKPSRMVLGWLPYWEFGKATLHLDQLTVLAYFAAAMNAQSKLPDLKHWDTPQMQDLIAAAHAQGTAVVLTITCFDSDTIHAIVATEESRAKAVDAIVTAVAAVGGDGANIDFEGVKAADRANMLAFVSALKKAMDEALGTSHVSLATPAVDWSNAWDYAGLAKAADALAFMGYGYHWQGGNPGPVAPLESSTKWGKYSLAWTIDDYLSAGAPQEKVVMGLPLYGYDWPSTGPEVPGTKVSKGTAVVYADCRAKTGWQWDEASSTPYLVYQAGSTWHQLWCEDPTSLSAKMGLSNETDIGGIAFWALGYEGTLDDPWEAVAALFPPGPTPQADETTTEAEEVGEVIEGPGPVAVDTAPEPASKPAAEPSPVEPIGEAAPDALAPEPMDAPLAPEALQAPEATPGPDDVAPVVLAAHSGGGCAAGHGRPLALALLFLPVAFRRSVGRARR